MRTFKQGFFTCYAIAGTLMGIAAKVAYPAMNIAGILTNAILWPLLPLTAIFDTDLMPSPAWMYSTQAQVVYVEN